MLALEHPCKMLHECETCHGGHELKKNKNYSTVAAQYISRLNRPQCKRER